MKKHFAKLTAVKKYLPPKQTVEEVQRICDAWKWNAEQQKKKEKGA